MNPPDDVPATDIAKPGLIRGEELADDAAAPIHEDFEEQAEHPGGVRGDDLADDAAQGDEAAEHAAEQAEHPGGVRGDDLAG